MEKQKTKPCSTCPFLRNLNYGLPRETLERTVVDYLNHERIHPCHGDGDYFCAGYLSFMQYKTKRGILGGFPARLAVMSGVIDLEMVDPNLEIFGSVEEMLAVHEEKYHSREAP